MKPKKKKKILSGRENAERVLCDPSPAEQILRLLNE